MKIMPVGKTLKTFSCAEIRDKKAIGENTAMLSRAFAVKNLEAPNFYGYFSILNGHWFIHLLLMGTLNTGTSMLVAKTALGNTLPPYIWDGQVHVKRWFELGALAKHASVMRVLLSIN